MPTKACLKASDHACSGHHCRRYCLAVFKSDLPGHVDQHQTVMIFRLPDPHRSCLCLPQPCDQAHNSIAWLPLGTISPMHQALFKLMAESRHQHSTVCNEHSSQRCFVWMQVREAGEEAWLGKAAPEVPQLDRPPAEGQIPSATPNQAAIGNHRVSGSSVSHLDIMAASNPNALQATGQPAIIELQHIMLQ